MGKEAAKKEQVAKYYPSKLYPVLVYTVAFLRQAIVQCLMLLGYFIEISFTLKISHRVIIFILHFYILKQKKKISINLQWLFSIPDSSKTVHIRSELQLGFFCPKTVM